MTDFFTVCIRKRKLGKLNIEIIVYAADFDYGNMYARAFLRCVR